MLVVSSIFLILKKNLPIKGLMKAKLSANIFHAGTAIVDGQLVTSGGRVLGVTSTAPDIHKAVKKVYQTINVIEFENMYFRKDIAHRALAIAPEVKVDVGIKPDENVKENSQADFKSQAQKSLLKSFSHK